MSTPVPEPSVWSWIFAAGSAFGGSVARGVTDWRDPKTEKFSTTRFLTSVATAVLVGEVTIGICNYFHVDPLYSGPAAGVFGYLGPAAMISIVFNRLGVSSNAPKGGTSDVPNA